MKTLLLFLAGLAVAILVMALGSGRLDTGALLAATGAAALLASAFTDRLPHPRLQLTAVSSAASAPAPAAQPPLDSPCGLCTGTAS